MKRREQVWGLSPGLLHSLCTDQGSVRGQEGAARGKRKNKICWKLKVFPGGWGDPMLGHMLLRTEK